MGMVMLEPVFDAQPEAPAGDDDLAALVRALPEALTLMVLRELRAILENGYGELRVEVSNGAALVRPTKSYRFSVK